MTDDQTELQRHKNRVASVADGVAKLALLPIMTPEALLEGAVKGAFVGMAAVSDITGPEFAELLEGLACGYRQPERPKLHVVE